MDGAIDADRVDRVRVSSRLQKSGGRAGASNAILHRRPLSAGADLRSDGGDVSGNRRALADAQRAAPAAAGAGGAARSSVGGNYPGIEWRDRDLYSRCGARTEIVL